MEDQKIINLLENTPDQPYKFRTKNWDEINDSACEMCNNNSQIKFKTSTLKSRLCDYSDTYILVSQAIIVFGSGAKDAAIAPDRNNKQAIFKNCALFSDCITEINNMQV